MQAYIRHASTQPFIKRELTSTEFSTPCSSSGKVLTTGKVNLIRCAQSLALMDAKRAGRLFSRCR